MSTNTGYFPAMPSLMRRTDSDSSIDSTGSQSVRTPTDSIFHRNDDDFGGEPGLAMEDVAEGIKTLLAERKLFKFQFQPTSTMVVGRGIVVTWKVAPLLDRDGNCLQVRMTEDEVKQLVGSLDDDQDLEVNEAKSLLSRHLPGAMKYTVASSSMPARLAQAHSPDSPRGSSRITLHEFSKPAPRMVRSEYTDGEED